MQVQGRKTYARTANSAAYHHFTGKECLVMDVHLLKPARVDVLPGQPDVVCADDVQQGPAWLEHQFRKSHLIIRKTGSVDRRELWAGAAHTPSATWSGRRGS